MFLNLHLLSATTANRFKVTIEGSRDPAVSLAPQGRQHSFNYSCTLVVLPDLSSRLHPAKPVGNIYSESFRIIIFQRVAQSQCFFFSGLRPESSVTPPPPLPAMEKKIQNHQKSTKIHSKYPKIFRIGLRPIRLPPPPHLFWSHWSQYKKTLETRRAQCALSFHYRNLFSLLVPGICVPTGPYSH